MALSLQKNYFWNFFHEIRGLRQFIELMLFMQVRKFYIKIALKMLRNCYLYHCKQKLWPDMREFCSCQHRQEDAGKKHAVGRKVELATKFIPPPIGLLLWRQCSPSPETLKRIHKSTRYAIVFHAIQIYQHCLVLEFYFSVFWEGKCQHSIAWFSHVVFTER
jgi:hypothetical protein